MGRHRPPASVPWPVPVGLPPAVCTVKPKQRLRSWSSASVFAAGHTTAACFGCVGDCWHGTSSPSASSSTTSSSWLSHTVVAVTPFNSLQLNWLPLLSSLQKPLSGHTALVVCSLSRSLIGVSLSYTIFIYCFHITNAFAGAASISAYVPLKQKTKTQCERNRVALGWGFSFRATRRGRPPWVEARRFQLANP